MGRNDLERLRALDRGARRPSASATSGFTLVATGVEGQKSGLLFYGTSGAKASVWYLDSQCVVREIAYAAHGLAVVGRDRGGLRDGALTLDLAAWLAAHPAALGQPLVAGEFLLRQGWFPGSRSRPARRNLRTRCRRGSSGRAPLQCRCASTFVHNAWATRSLPNGVRWMSSGARIVARGACAESSGRGVAECVEPRSPSATQKIVLARER